MKRNEAYKLWAFKYHDGVIPVSSIKWKRNEVIVWAENFFEVQWRQIKRSGNSAVKVELKEVKS
ncbi:hypothetical protein [Sphingobacterium sp.]|uniref:hypothetical protein n=1 Tax=Sphingobacterium sp. TaxID=341027 RepID=UPI0028A0B030|nr:hypothetical protein [Sphingobacterium sp.]